MVRTPFMRRHYPGRALRLGAALGLLAGSAFAQSLRPGWGATPYAATGATGVTFRVWAPNATSVYVAGTFNGWNSAVHPLTLESTNTGVWSRDVASARTNHNYKYVINGNLWRSDPRSRIINGADNNNSVITGTNSFNWSGDQFRITNASDLVIYEVHVGSFTGPGGTFSSMSNRLAYLQELGVSALELMPINEFPTPTSWGYNPAYPFAVESSYGAPDHLKALVQQAHRHGLVTLLDVVHNHWDGDSALWQFDGGVIGPYFYGSDPFTYTPWGPRPDYSKPEVRDYITDTFRMWLDEYHLSGFRWDAPRHSIYTTNNVFIPDGLLMITNALTAIASEHPGTWNIAEDTKDINGFNYSWDFTFSGELRWVLTQSDDNFRDLPTVARNLNAAPNRIIYTDSHDTAGDLNGGQRLPTAIHSGDPAGYYARKRSALGAAIAFTAPGTPMILQGQELLETNQFSDTRGMDWSRTNSQAGTRRLYRDLIRLRRNLDGVSRGLTGDAVNTYLVDNVNKLLAYSRWSSAETGGQVVVVANFANTTRTAWPVRFPEEGTWYTLFNSDSTNYAPDYANAGLEQVNAVGSPPQGAITIGPYSALILSRTPRAGLLVHEQHHLDQPIGNGNGQLDPGEVIRARLVLWNKSQIAATQVVAHLISDTPGVSVVQASSAYPDMPANGYATNVTWFTYQLSSTQTCGSAASLRLLTTFNQITVTNLLDPLVGHIVHVPPATNWFPSQDTPIFIPDTSTVYSLLTINEAGSNLLTDVDVHVRINHTWDRDVTLGLQHPDGTEVLLVRRRGGSGDNFGTGSGACESMVYTVFDQAAGSAISNGAAPFAGRYRPETTLDLFNGKPLNGTWRLRMRDETTQDVGTNLCWGIRAAYEQRLLDCTAYSNRAPVVTGTNLLLVHYGPSEFHLTGSDPDGQPLHFAALSTPNHGRYTLLEPTNGWTRYQPVHGFQGTDVFSFVASDGLTTSTPAVVSIVLPPPTDANTNGLPDAWEQIHFTNLVGLLAHDDADGDGVDNRGEYLAHTDPLDSHSVLRLTRIEATENGYEVRWDAIGGTRYLVEFSTGLDPATFQPVDQALDLSTYGVTSALTLMDDFTLTPSPATNLMRLYRVRVLNE